NANPVQKVYFPREILVGATVASWLVSFLIELGVLALVLAFFGNIVVPWVPVVLLLVVLQTMFVTGIALALAGAAVYFRDLQHLLGLVLQVWLYSAPIVYPVALVEGEVGTSGWKITLYNLNPLTRSILTPLPRSAEAYRAASYHLRLPPLDDLAYLVGVSVAVLLAGWWAFSRLEGRLAEEL